MNKTFSKNTSFPFYLLVIGLFLVLISKDILSNGMFMDGLLYSAISKNLSQGLGSFWSLHLSNTLFNNFHEHPPLAFGLQSIFYDIFGYDRIVDKLYSIFTFMVVGFLIVRIWKELGKSVIYGWVPLLFWASIPLVIWATTNNILENTLSIFISLSVLFFLKSLKNREILFLFLSGIMLSFGFLTKGFVAFFPWVLPFLYWLIFKNRLFIKTFFNTLIIIIGSLLPLILLILFSEVAKDSIFKYLDKQVFESIKNSITVNSRFFIVNRLFFEILPALIIFIIFAIFAWQKKMYSSLLKHDIKLASIFTLLALSGVIPIMISLKQSGFYILPTFPFFAIAFAIMVMPVVEILLQKINFNSKWFKMFKYFSLIIFICGIILSVVSKNNYRKVDERLKELYQIMDTLPNNCTINICQPMYQDWSLHGYFSRYKNISLDKNISNQHKYFLFQNNCCNDTLISKNYYLIDFPSKEYKLFEFKK